jgi:hypothetical protein
LGLENKSSSNKSVFITELHFNFLWPNANDHIADVQVNWLCIQKSWSIFVECQFEQWITSRQYRP